MYCLNCSAHMIGDGYTSVMECENSMMDTSSYAPDEGPVYCSDELIESTEEVDTHVVNRTKDGIVVEIAGMYLNNTLARKHSDVLNSKHWHNIGTEFTVTSVTGEVFNHSVLAKAEFGDDYSMYTSYMAQWAHLVPLTPLEYTALGV